MSTTAASPSDAGLQAERTGLAWSRTSLGVGANAVLLGVREVGHSPTVTGLAPAVLALVVAVVVAAYGRHRCHVLRTAPLPTPLAASRAIPLVGAAVVALALISGAAVLA